MYVTLSSQNSIRSITMRKIFISFLLAVAALLLATTKGLACTKVVVRQNMDLVKLFAGANTEYVIKTDIDLGGMTIKIGDGSSLQFKGGRLSNGTLQGNFTLKHVKSSSLSVRFSNCSILGVVPIYNNSSVVDLLSSCMEGCKLMEDITIDKSVKLHGSIDGNGHSITCSANTPVALYINDVKTPITIQRLTLIKRIPFDTINQNYAINVTNSSNITIKNSMIKGRISFVNKTLSDAPKDISENISILDSKLIADFSSCTQGWEYGQDHLAFYSIKNVRIENCFIESVNVNRVIKTSAYFPNENYVHPQNCTDGFVFRNNTIKATADYGKQFWDMYCGTVNVLIENNDIVLKGFTRLIENKAYQKKYKGDDLISSLIEIKNNAVIIEHGNLFQFKTNSEVDSFLVCGNSFVLTGENVNPTTRAERSSVMLLQGYRYCKIHDNSIVMKDEAIGLPLATVNFRSLDTRIIDNDITDASRINFFAATPPSGDKTSTQCDVFVYSGNRKAYSQRYGAYSKIELYMVQSEVTDLVLDIPGEPVSEDNVIEFGTGAKVQGLSIHASSPNRKNLFRVHKAAGADVKLKSNLGGTTRDKTDY